MLFVSFAPHSQCLNSGKKRFWNLSETGPALVGIELAAARDYEGLVARMRGIQFRELKEDDLMMRYVV